MKTHNGSSCRTLLNQAGLSLIEILLALAIATSMLVGLSSYMWDQTRSQQDVLLAQYHNIVTQAAQNYIQDNYSSISAGSLPATITVAQLISGGYLSTAVSSTNALGQTVCVKVVQPESGSLSAMVMGTGTNTTYSRAAHIASLIGALGGAVDSTGAVKGAGGSWNIDYSTAATYGTCSSGVLSAGQFVSFLYFSNGSLVSDFLHRSYVGSLSANTMNVPLGLSLKTAGVDCTGYVGFITRDTSGNVLACVNSSGTYTWTTTSGSWKSPVTNYAALPLSGNSDGDVRMELGNYRAYVWSASGAAWKAIAVDNSGNMSVPGTLTSGPISASGTVTTTGQVSATGAVSGSTLLANLTATAGASCSSYPAGSIAKDNTGKVLSCQGGLWASSTLSLTTVTAALTGWSWPATTASCGAGKTIISGGVDCSSGGGASGVEVSRMNGNGWYGQCFTQNGFGRNLTVYVYAYCAG